MRMFVTNVEGTGSNLGPFQLDPPVTDGEVTQSEYWVTDRFRPVGVVGPWAGLPIEGRGPQMKFLVVALEMTAAPNGAYDIGDPTSAADMDRALSNPEQRTVESLFEQPRRTFDGFTWRQLARWTIPNQPRFACAFRGQGIELFDEVG